MSTLTKEQISDWRSHHDRVVQCALAKAQAENQLQQATTNLETFLWRLENEKSDSPKGEGK